MNPHEGFPPQTSLGAQILTDGSKIKGKVGTPVSLWKDEVDINHSTQRLESFSNVFQA